MEKFSLKYIILAISIISFLFAEGAKAQPSSKNNIHYLTDTNTNFDGLISQFKGKVIYVDMWATWCSPCRHELQSKKDVKGFEDFALKNDIVVLYICCDKNGDKWKQFVTANKLNGYHILINNFINKDFHTTFSIVQKRQGKIKKSFYLPRHLIIDKKGMVVDSTADRQGSAAVYAQMNKILNRTSLQLTK